MMSNSSQFINELNSFLNGANTEQEKIDKLRIIIENTKKSDYSNKDEVVKILEDKMKDLVGKIDNQKALDTLQTSNSDFYKLNIIKTSKLDNDSKKDINYLSFTDSFGRVQMVELEDEKQLSNFIEEHQGTSYTAEDVFKYFREHKSDEVKFYDEDNYEDLAKYEEDRAVVNDDNTKSIEMDKVREYANDHNLVMNDIEVAIDQEGERIYRLGGTVLKFKENLQGERDLIVLQSDMTLQIPDEKEQEEATDSKYSISDDAENVQSSKIENIEYEVTLNQFNEIVYKFYDQGIPLTGEESIILEAYVDFLLKDMDDKIANEMDPNNDYTNALEGYMTITGETYVNQQTGESEVQLSEKQIEQLNRYNQLVPEMELLKKKYKTKKLELVSTEQGESGKANTVIILELCAIAALVISFIAHV